MDFQRARSEEQREQRRQAILSETAAMLTEMPVAQVSLSELSRRVGLAKSNVLRYFDSREAILLELLDDQARGWVADLDQAVDVAGGEPVGRRIDLVSAAIAATLAARPMLCDLLHAESGVLERNVSAESVLRHKRATQQTAAQVARILIAALPELSLNDTEDIIVTLLLIAAAAWPYAQPGAALAAAYEQDASVAAMHRDFTAIVHRTLELTTTGLLAQGAATAT